MKPNAIVFTSNTGYTEQYARLLGQKTGLPVYALDEARERLAPGNHILYLGWLMAGTVKGYTKAVKQYHVEAVCGVGMGAAGSQLQDVRKTNRIPESMPLFTLQGGFDLQRLHGVYRVMMNIMARTAGKGLADKQNRTPEEDDMLDMMLHGGSRVREEQLDGVVEWYRKE